MLQLRVVGPGIAVAPQIAPQDLSALTAAGYRLVINNRPDDEEGGQPSGDAIEAAAMAAGIGYVAIPISHAGFSRAEVDAMAAALASADGPVLAYCRSGTRSIHLWALARAAQGDAPEVLIAQAANAGYDLAGIRPLLQTLVSAV